MADETEPGKAGSALTAEQLLDYIKKQKLKIKRLEKDKETLTKQVNESTEAVVAANAAVKAAENAASAATNEAKAVMASAETKTPLSVASSSSSSSSTSGSMFWDLIDKESPFQRKLATSAITLLTSTIKKSNFGKKSIQPSRRSLFDAWRIRTMELRAEAAVREAAEVKAEFASLEQKTAKLKALLSRTHQANKRFEEDTTSFKRAQKDAAMQLKAMKEREDGERMALLETVRVHTIESAFQQDMELVIQRAAESMLKTGSDGYTGSSVNHGPSSATAVVASGFNSLTTKLSALEGENIALKTQLEALEGTVGELVAEATARQSLLEKAEKDLAKSKDVVEKLKATAAESQKQAEEGVRLRQDMELELDILTKGRADMIRCVETSMAEKSAQQIAELRAEVAALRDRSAGMHHPSSSSGGAKGGSSSNGGAGNSDRAARSNNRLPSRGPLGAAGSDAAARHTQMPSSSSMSLGGGLTPGLMAVSSTRTAPPPVGTITYALPTTASAISRSNPGNGSGSGNGDAAVAVGGASDTSTTFTCESLIVKAADDFRLVIPVPACPGTFRLSWDFTVNVPRPKSASSSSPSSSSSSSSNAPAAAASKKGRAVDIGFSVMEKLSTGSLPQLLPYSRVKSPGDRNAIILGATNTDGDNANFSRSLILLFDNSYSWVQSKEITYTVSVEPVQ